MSFMTAGGGHDTLPKLNYEGFGEADGGYYAHRREVGFSAV